MYNFELNDNISRTYDKKEYTKINMDILEPMEKDIVYRRYIQKPRDISYDIAKEYGITREEVVKISLRGIRKIKKEYMIENEML